MKHVFIKLFLFIFVFSFVLSSCDKKDNEDIEKKQEIVFGDKSFDLSWGLLEYFGKLEPNDEAYNFDLMLFSSGLEYVDSTEEISGKGSGIYFEMFSESATELVPGTYNLDTTSINMKPFTFDFSGLSYNYDSATEDSEIELELKSGSVKIEKSGDEYEITIEAMGESGEKITGYYKGTLKYNDFSKKKTYPLKKKVLK